MENQIKPPSESEELHYFQQFSIATKTICLSLLISLSVWGILDHFQSKKLRDIFNAQLDATLQEQATEDRGMFDEYVRSYGNATRLIISQKRMADYIESSDWLSSASTVIQYQDLPPWLPPASVLRALPYIRFFLLLKPDGTVREFFDGRQDGVIEETLRKPSNLLRQLSHNQTYLTTINGTPFVITSIIVKHEKSGETQGIFMLASPIDNEFMQLSLNTLRRDNLEAIVDSKSGAIIASSHPQEIPAGSLVNDLQKKFVITGKSYFDYGSSDLDAYFISLLTKSKYDSLSKELLKTDRLNRAITGFALIACIIVLIFYIVGKINKLMLSIDLFAVEKLGSKPHRQSGGDQLFLLEERFSDLTKDVIDAQDLLDHQVYQLEQERQRAEQASVAKSEFLANMSHEIRTPMNAIIGFTDLLLRKEIPTEEKNYITLIRSSGHRMLDLINDILNFSKIEAGKIKLNEEHFDLEVLLEESMKTLAVKAHEKNLELTWSMSSGGPSQLIGDSGKIRQLLVNLVGNAIKFTDKGNIVVSVREEISQHVANQEPDFLSLHFSIKDTGIGIPLDQQKNIFKSFTQADGSLTRQFGGTGLGLSISAQFARLMKGDLWVESELGKGSTFHFLVRLKKATADTTKTDLPNNESKKHFRVLLVDDEPINRTLTVAVLEENDFHVEEAENGEQALAMVEENNFDVILMDIQMPVMDGIEATRTLREKEKNTGKHVPIIAVTAHAAQGDMEKCREAGMNDYISKPFKAKKLVEIIQKLVP